MARDVRSPRGSGRRDDFPDGIAVRALELVGPMRLDLLDDRVRQRDVIERLGLVLALLQGPVEELKRQMILIGRAVLAQQHVGRRGDRPALVAGLIGEDQIEILHLGEVGVCGGGLEGVHGRRDGLAGLIDHVGVGHVIFDDVGILDIADRAVHLLDIGGNTGIALAADAVRPIDRGAFTDLALPVRADLRQIIGEVEGGAGAVGAMHRGDRLMRQIDVGVELFDRRIVPLFDVAEIDPARVGPSNTSSPGLMPARCTTGVIEMITCGNCTKPFLATSSGFSGMSVLANNTSSIPSA